jgi:hypothetical protein
VLFPTLAWIALDVLPCQASSVPCERLFSASKQTADLRRSSLGAKHFEELQVMKFAWCKNLMDHAAQNWTRIEELQLGEYCDILDADKKLAKWDLQLHNENKFLIEYED